MNGFLPSMPRNDALPFSCPSDYLHKILHLQNWFKDMQNVLRKRLNNVQMYRHELLDNRSMPKSIVNVTRRTRYLEKVYIQSIPNKQPDTYKSHRSLLNIQRVTTFHET